MKNQYESFARRLTSASPLQMIIINFELLIMNIESGDIPAAKDFLRLLEDSLDMSYDISQNLLSLYIYVYKLLNDAGFTKSEEQAKVYLCDAKAICEKILSGFQEIPQDTAETVMDNSQTIYAGLTYGNGRRGTLDEYVPVDSNRGFKA